MTRPGTPWLRLAPTKRTQTVARFLFNVLKCFLFNFCYDIYSLLLVYFNKVILSHYFYVSKRCFQVVFFNKKVKFKFYFILTLPTVCAHHYSMLEDFGVNSWIHTVAKFKQNCWVLFWFFFCQQCMFLKGFQRYRNTIS